MGRERKHYGRGRWPEKQLYAIVATYREQGRDEQWVSDKLGVGVRKVTQIYEYFHWCEEAEYLEAVEAAGWDPADQIV